MTSLAFMFVDVPAPPWYRPARTDHGSGRRGSPGPPRRSRPGRRAASRRRRSWRAPVQREACPGSGAASGAVWRGRSRSSSRRRGEFVRRAADRTRCPSLPESARVRRSRHTRSSRGTARSGHVEARSAAGKPPPVEGHLDIRTFTVTRAPRYVCRPVNPPCSVTPSLWPLHTSGSGNPQQPSRFHARCSTSRFRSPVATFRHRARASIHGERQHRPETSSRRSSRRSRCCRGKAIRTST